MACFATRRLFRTEKSWAHASNSKAPNSIATTNGDEHHGGPEEFEIERRLFHGLGDSGVQEPADARSRRRSSEALTGVLGRLSEVRPWPISRLRSLAAILMERHAEPPARSPRAPKLGVSRQRPQRGSGEAGNESRFHAKNPGIVINGSRRASPRPFLSSETNSRLCVTPWHLSVSTFMARACQSKSGTIKERDKRAWT